MIIFNFRPNNVAKLLKSAGYCQGATKCNYKSFAMYSPLTIATVCFFPKYTNIQKNIQLF